MSPFKGQDMELGMQNCLLGSVAEPQILPVEQKVDR